VISNYRAENIYGVRRTEVRDGIKNILGERMLAEGLELSDLIVRNVSFSDEFANAIEQREIAEQSLLRENDEAERIRVRAAGARDAEIAAAEGQARSIVLRAEAEAQALRLVSEQLAANPTLIQYEYIQKLADNISLALVPSSSPFLFDFDSLAAANSSFVPPEVPASAGS
ncbi:MAG: SPFH domain-containing protein, partial [Anaerolineaceae bacterium]|nr:SPFH domain-containing protein [Anaerolineaceae bacterium]